jgi:hypothetical protein
MGRTSPLRPGRAGNTVFLVGDRRNGAEEKFAMKIVQADQLPLERGLEYRGGMFHFRRVLEGEPGTIGNFQLSLGQSSGDFYSPRHRHNFEQIRFQIEGTLEFGRDGKMKPGMVGYFPEGVAYGPQTQQPDQAPLTAVLQFGGASGSGYIARDEVKQGMTELRQYGEFKDGIYRRNADVPGKRNLDGYQAVWEHINKRPMKYPKGRYEKPVFMDSASYEWVASDDEPGVHEKLLGVFTERRTETSFLKLEPGAAHQAKGRGIRLVVSGTGAAAGQPLRRLTTIYLERGEKLRLAADTELVMLHLGLPDLAGLAARRDTCVMAQAAE